MLKQYFTYYIAIAFEESYKQNFNKIFSLNVIRNTNINTNINNLSTIIYFSIDQQE